MGRNVQKCRYEALRGTYALLRLFYFYRKRVLIGPQGGSRLERAVSSLLQMEMQVW
jgi:hypothetical protein